MATVKVKRAGKTKEQVVTMLKQSLQEKYEVNARTYMLGPDFLVKKNAISGVFIKVNVNSKKGMTSISYDKNAPNLLFRGPLSKWFGDQQVVKDVKSSIDGVLESC